MTQPTGDDLAPPKIHHVIMIQMAVNIFCAVLIIFSKERPDTFIANSVHWWIERSAGAIRILLFFEPWPPTEETEKIVEGMQIYRHVLAVSLLIALCSIMASRPYLPDWSAILSAKLKAAGYSKAKYAELALIPALADADSRRGFPNRLKSDSAWRTRGGSSWRQRLGFERIMMRVLCGR